MSLTHSLARAARASAVSRARRTSAASAASIGAAPRELVGVARDRAVEAQRRERLVERDSARCSRSDAARRSAPRTATSTSPDRRGSPRSCRHTVSTFAGRALPQPGMPGMPSAVSPTSASRSGIDARRHAVLRDTRGLVERDVLPAIPARRRASPRTHWHMSLSSDAITTCSTRGSSAQRAARGRDRVVGLELDHRPHDQRRAPRRRAPTIGNCATSARVEPSPVL